MGLSDIDEDEPPLRGTVVQRSPAAIAATTAATSDAVVVPAAPCSSSSGSGKVNLDDLFGPVGAQTTYNNNNNNNTMAVASPVTPPSTRAAASMASSGAHDVLDSLFAAPATTAGAASPSSSSSPSSDAHAASPLSTGAGEPILYVDDTTPMACDVASHAGHMASSGGSVPVSLLDLSQPVQRQRHESAESILAAFEQQGKRRGFDDKSSLAHLTRNKDDNKVKARLLALMNYYDVLGVAPTATTDEIRQSYKKKALALHPDKAGQHQTAEEAELFKIITKAHEVLTDDAQRSAYDAHVCTDAFGSAAGVAAATRGNWLQHLRPTS